MRVVAIDHWNTIRNDPLLLGALLVVPVMLSGMIGGIVAWLLWGGS